MADPSFNQVYGYYSLQGDGTSNKRGKIALEAAPSGANAVTYIMQLYAKGPQSTGSFGTTVVYPPTCYWGFKFNGTYPTTTQSGHSDYDDFFGVASADTSAPYTSWDMYFSSGSAYYGPDNGANTDHEVYDANGGSIETNPSSTYDQYFLKDSGGGFAKRYTFFWRVYTHPSDDSVLWETWNDANYLDFDTLDLYNDISDADPKSSFSYSNLRSGTLHGDTTGTNWRPSTGTMAFPTYFMISNPTADVEFRVQYLGVKYSVLTS